jgi:hypothetical protein
MLHGTFKEESMATECTKLAGNKFREKEVFLHTS